MSIRSEIEVKICGLKTRQTVESAVAAGANYIGFNHFPKSPRFIEPVKAAGLAGLLPASVAAVCLLVDPSDEEVEACAPWTDWIQLHGKETPQRCAQVAALSKKPILKAIAVSGQEDIARAETYQGFADMLLLDAAARELPGGNGIAFDWRILQNQVPKMPWMLAGGLNPENVIQAIGKTGATRVDVSSGIEVSDGEKSVDLIEAFVKAAKQKNKD